MQELWQAGRAAWPGIDVSAGAFARHLGRDAAGEASSSAKAVHAAELYLTAACAAGNPAALAVFDERYLGKVGVFLSRMRPQPAFIDEVRQVLREKLFTGAVPKIAEYGGQGDLIGWLRVVTMRTALNMQRRKTEVLDGRQDSRHGVGPAATYASPELAYVKEQHRAGFKAALEAAFAALSSEQRNLLRLHFLEGMTLHQVAVLSGVHRATVARWIAEARQQIMSHARSQLQDRLALDSGELDSMMGLLQSGLDLSIARLLASRPGV